MTPLAARFSAHPPVSTLRLAPAFYGFRLRNREPEALALVGLIRSRSWPVQTAPLTGHCRLTFKNPHFVRLPIDENLVNGFFTSTRESACPRQSDLSGLHRTRYGT